MSLMQSVVLSTAASIALAGVVAANSDAPPQGRVLLTVGGDVETANREPSSDDTRSMFDALAVDFDKAVAFDADALAALDQGAYEASLFDDGFTGTFSGPRLAAILEAVGRPDASVTALAFDQYSALIPAEVIATYDPILATHLDDRPFAIGGIGPAVVVFPSSDDPEEAEELDVYQVWATFYLNVE